jgi:16S rRNA G527 N7-methylase RsmG
MVESKTRKAAFLRECVRTLALAATTVENRRFEDLAAADECRDSAQLVTVRAVRPVPGLFKVAAELLSNSGRLMLFGQRAKSPAPTGRNPRGQFSAGAFGLDYEETVPLVDGARSELAIYRRVFHVERGRGT